MQLLSAADALSALVQFKTCLSKNAMVYWRDPDYNAVRCAACFLPNLTLRQLSHSLLYTVVDTLHCQLIPRPKSNRIFMSQSICSLSYQKADLGSPWGGPGFGINGASLAKLNLVNKAARCTAMQDLGLGRSPGKEPALRNNGVYCATSAMSTWLPRLWDTRS